jgi:hypothetical protein
MNEEKKPSDFSLKLKNWLKDRHNLVFSIILILVLFLGLYFFSITKSQPIWWDESDYLAYAKNLAGYNVDWVVTAKHNSLFPFVVAGLFILGLSEISIKFILEFIPFILLVILTYFTASSMYNKKVGAISAFLIGLLSEVLFNVMRFHVDIPALMFAMLSLYIFWQGYENKEKLFGIISPNWAIPLAVLSIIISYSFRRGYFLFGIFFLVYLLLTMDFKKEIKNKYNWIGLILAIILIIFVETTIFSAGITNVAEGYAHVDRPINLLPFKVFSSFFSNFSNSILSPLLYLFWIGFFMLIFNTLIYIGHIKKLKNKQVKADLFNLIVIISTLLFFILVLREQTSFGEARWYFPLLFSSLICISKSSDLIYSYLKKYNKQLGIIVILVLIGFGAYHQVQQANLIISNKISSFEGVKQAGIYLNKNSLPSDIIISVPTPQTAYYSERQILNPRKWTQWDSYEIPQEVIFGKIQENSNITYLLVSFSEPNHPSWMKTQTQTTWEIPFMDTKIDFQQGIQEIKQEKTFGNLTFKLLEVKQDVFIYNIERV